ncbi:hypothetical protein L1987_15704 [Smallanthus sonchifolius]|uniref:Uncharacterized protein n=1 Tax=Smallanthus sonchifolius TaxID=185202 RepID=A0ACB9J763_9ASTR|nr:hypothetical protein L1987_15704 [Smallanthus sonchifolius]
MKSFPISTEEIDFHSVLSKCRWFGNQSIVFSKRASSPPYRLCLGLQLCGCHCRIRSQAISGDVSYLTIGVSIMCSICCCMGCLLHNFLCLDRWEQFSSAVHSCVGGRLSRWRMGLLQLDRPTGIAIMTSFFLILYIASGRKSMTEVGKNSWNYPKS